MDAVLGRVGVSSGTHGDDPLQAAARSAVRWMRVPGDTIEYHVRKIARKKNMWWYRGEAKVAGLLVAEAEVGAMVA